MHWYKGTIHTAIQAQAHVITLGPKHHEIRSTEHENATWTSKHWKRTVCLNIATKDTHALWVEVKCVYQFKSDDALACHLLLFIMVASVRISGDMAMKYSDFYKECSVCCMYNVKVLC